MPLRVRAAVLLTGVCLLAACTDADDDGVGGRSSETTTSEVGTSDEVDEAEDAEETGTTVEFDPDDLPDGAVGDQVAWILEGIAAGGVDDGAFADHVAAVVREELSPSELSRALSQLAAQDPWRLEQVTQAGGDRNALVRLTNGAGNIVDLHVGVDADGLVDGLFFLPGPPTIPIEDLEDGVDRLAAAAPTTGVTVVHLDGDGAATTLASHEADVPRALASVAKIYVADAVAQAVEDGELAWDDELEVTDEDRSLPSGRLQHEPAGTTATVEDLTAAMMAISDNTATDLLITAVGRDRVEEAVVASGHATPEQLAPFLRTRELFAIGWDRERRTAWEQAWAANDDGARRDIVDEVGPGTGGVEATNVTTPAWESGADWWASPDDLVAIWTRLLDRDDPVLREVLAADLGGTLGMATSLEADVWPFVGFKPGGSPGVWSATYAMERADGERFVLAVAINGGTGLSANTAAGVVEALLAELAEVEVG